MTPLPRQPVLHYSIHRSAAEEEFPGEKHPEQGRVVKLVIHFPKENAPNPSVIEAELNRATESHKRMPNIRVGNLAFKALPGWFKNYRSLDQIGSMEKRFHPSVSEQELELFAAAVADRLEQHGIVLKPLPKT